MTTLIPIEELEAHGMRLFASRTTAKDVVRIEGSIYGGENMVHGNNFAIAGLTAELLDAGTKHHAKDSLRALLASKGASLSFVAGGDRLPHARGGEPDAMPDRLGKRKASPRTWG